MTKAKSVAQRRKSRGRPKKDDAPRTASGRISRSNSARQIMTAAEERLMLEAATWKRRQANPALSIHEARKPEHGSVIANWLARYQSSKKRDKEGTHEEQFTRTHFDTAQAFHELHERYRCVIGSMNQRSASEFGRSGGHDNSNPFSDGAVRDERTEQRYKAARRAILEAGPLCMFAVESIVIENREMPRLRGDLRLALNALAAMWKIDSEPAAAA